VPAPNLRPATLADLPWLQALARDPAVAPYLATIAADQLAAALADEAQEVLVVEHAGERAGGARLARTNARHRIYEIATVMLDPALRGRGLGAATLRALAARALAAGAHRVQAEVLAGNPAGLAAFAAAGFTREGVRRAAWWRDGRWQDGIHVGLLAGELPEG
jgi:RimJ/RimL family protein N-acetyltransferase